MNGFDRLKDSVESGSSPSITGRELLAWIGAERRGSEVVRRIRVELWRRGIATEPDFNDVWIDVPLAVVRAAAPMSAPSDDERPGTEPPPPSLSATVESSIPVELQVDSDRKMRSVGRLDAANRLVGTIGEGATLVEATTEMRLHGVDHLVVLSSKGEARGVVTWRRIAEAALLSYDGRLPSHVRSVVESVEHVAYDSDIAEAIDRMEKCGYVLVKDKRGVTTGLVTFRDVGVWFREQSEAFIVLGDIERALRVLVSTFPMDEIRTCLDRALVGEINDVTELTFGSLIRVLDEPTRWARLELGLDRVRTVKALHDAREGRNSIVHLSVDSVEPRKVVAWRRLAKELERCAEARKYTSTLR